MPLCIPCITIPGVVLIHFVSNAWIENIGLGECVGFTQERLWKQQQKVIKNVLDTFCYRLVTKCTLKQRLSQMHLRESYIGLVFSIPDDVYVPSTDFPFLN